MNSPVSKNSKNHRGKSRRAHLRQLQKAYNLLKKSKYRGDRVLRVYLVINTVLVIALAYISFKLGRG